METSTYDPRIFFSRSRNSYNARFSKVSYATRHFIAILITVIKNPISRTFFRLPAYKGIVFLSIAITVLTVILYQINGPHQPYMEVI